MYFALKQALDKGIPVADASYLAGISKEEFNAIFIGNTKIPLLDERYAILRENANILLKKNHGSLTNLLECTNNDAEILLSRISADFPSFNDQAIYKGEPVYFFKRAQLLVSDLSEILIKRKEKGLHNVDKLTAAADYKLPQILHYMGILTYSDGLSITINSKQQIPYGTEEEIELRANTILAINMIKESLKDKALTAMQLDYYLWLLSQDMSINEPYHRTRTIHY